MITTRRSVKISKEFYDAIKTMFLCVFVETETAEETENFHQFSQQFEKWKVKKLDKILINVEWKSKRHKKAHKKEIRKVFQFSHGNKFNFTCGTNVNFPFGNILKWKRQVSTWKTYFVSFLSSYERFYQNNLKFIDRVDEKINFLSVVVSLNSFYTRNSGETCSTSTKRSFQSSQNHKMIFECLRNNFSIVTMMFMMRKIHIVCSLVERCVEKMENVIFFTHKLRSFFINWWYFCCCRRRRKNTEMNTKKENSMILIFHFPSSDNEREKMFCYAHETSHENGNEDEDTRGEKTLISRGVESAHKHLLLATRRIKHQQCSEGILIRVLRRPQLSWNVMKFLSAG